jgi:hypothetical protein
LSGYARNLKKECAGLVAGQAVLTAEIVPYFSNAWGSGQYQGEGPSRIRRLSDLRFTEVGPRTLSKSLFREGVQITGTYQDFTASIYNAVLWQRI